MKVIFLDIDGVLNVTYRNHDKYGSGFHPHLVDNLKRIIDETGCKIVISSSWKLSGLDTLKSMWKDRNLPGEVIDITPDFYYEYTVRRGNIDFCRGDEIAEWLEKNEVEKYCIIDDDNDMLESQSNNFVRTSENKDHTDHVYGYGLTKECTDRVIEILNKP